MMSSLSGKRGAFVTGSLVQTPIVVSTFFPILVEIVCLVYSSTCSQSCWHLFGRLGDLKWKVGSVWVGPTGAGGGGVIRLMPCVLSRRCP
jgi:hypothetical protein